MRDNQPPSSSAATLVLHLPRALSKTQPIQHSEARPEQSRRTPIRWMSNLQKATAIAQHLTKLTHRRRTSTQIEAVADNDADPAKQSMQTLTNQTPIDSQQVDEHVARPDDPSSRQPPEPVVPATFTKRMQDMLSTIPSLASSIGSVSSRSASPAPETETHDGLSPTTPDSPVEHGWKSLWSAVGHLRLPYGRTTNDSNASRDEVLDCIDDNNSVMMYGPLEPDATSEVEIACSEIVSINGDGKEVRTPQPCYSPLPSESGDETLIGRGPRSPPPRFLPLPLESVDEELVRCGLRSPSPRFVPLHLESIDQVLMGGDEPSRVGWQESESEIASGAISPVQRPPAIEPPADQPPVKEYRVWLPSPTKISFQTMWWGFRIYLPPPVLDVLNNRQLEAAKRAALITTALQWLVDHLPLSLLPPQMHPGVAILRYLVPYVGYMGGFIAWTWSAIRSFDKGYGVVLTATWLLPFLLIPGTWEADEAPNMNADISP